MSPHISTSALTLLACSANGAALPPNLALFACEWAADMQFHEPGMIWMNGRMSMAIQDSPELGVQLRLLRNEALPCVTKDSTKIFDQVLNFSMGASVPSKIYADHPDLPSVDVSSKFAEGRFCRDSGGFYEQHLLVPLFLNPSPSHAHNEECGTVISTS